MLRQQLEWYSNNANYRLIYARCGNIFRDTTCSLVMSINISNAIVRRTIDCNFNTPNYQKQRYYRDIDTMRISGTANDQST